MRRRFIVMAVALVFSFAIETPMSRGDDQKKIIVKLGTVAPEETPWASHAFRIKRRLESESKRRIRAKVYLGAILGDELSLVSQCASGKVQIIGTSAGAFANEVPEMSIVELPFLFWNQKEADTVLDEMFDDFSKVLNERGFVLAAWTENGWRSFASKDRPIRTPDDLKGLRMRAQENRYHVEIYKQLGATPRAIGVAEVLSSIQTGIVDGFDSTPLFTFATSWHQGIRYYSLSDHIYQPALIAISRKFIESLPAGVSAVFTNFVANWKKESQWARRRVREVTPQLLKNFQRHGISVVQLSASERSALAQAMAPVHDLFKATVGPTGVALYEKAQAILSRLRGKSR